MSPSSLTWGVSGTGMAITHRANLSLQRGPNPTLLQRTKLKEICPRAATAHLSHTGSDSFPGPMAALQAGIARRTWARGRKPVSGAWVLLLSQPPPCSGPPSSPLPARTLLPAPFLLRPSLQPPPCLDPPSSPILFHFPPRNILNKFYLKLPKQFLPTILKFTVLGYTLTSPLSKLASSRWFIVTFC